MASWILNFYSDILTLLMNCWKSIDFGGFSFFDLFIITLLGTGAFRLVLAQTGTIPLGYGSLSSSMNSKKQKGKNIKKDKVKL